MRNKLTFKLGCLWLVILACTASFSAFGQTITGSITGTVTDPQGAVIPGAQVLATNESTGVKTTATTNDAGVYSIRFLQIGQYSITVRMTGYKSSTTQPFALEVDQTARRDVQLQIGESTQTVTVTNQLQPLLDTENSTVNTTFTSSSIDNLPLNGRNFSSLSMFVPGAVATQPTGMTGSNAIERSTGQNGQVSINGNRNQSNNYLLDGIEINETINNLIGYNPSPDAIGNLTVISSNADAEYGNVNGGDILAVLKSGTNQFHGSAFGYLENDNLDANTWSNNHNGVKRNPYTQRIFGGTIGGPILRDRLFFFADYMAARYNEGGQQQASVIPAAFRSGDFSALPYQLYHYVDGTGYVAYTNNQVPITNPVAKFLFAHPELYPLPNNTALANTYGGENNYIGSYRLFRRNDQGDIKIDYTLGKHDTIMGRYSQSNALDGQPSAPLLITFPTGNNYPFKGVAFNWIHTFSPNIVNEARAGFSRVRWVQGIPSDLTGAFGSKGNSIVGINSAQPYEGFSSLNFGSYGNATYYTSLGTSGGGTNFIDNTFDYSDDLTIQKGKHTMKAGVEILRYQQNNFYPGNDGAMGQFAYSNVYTSNPNIPGAVGFTVADFITDQAYFTGIGGITGRTGQRQYRDAFFAQDDYKFRPNLTLNLGLRYEYDQPIYEVNNKQANVNLQTGEVELAGQNGNSRALYNPTYTNFMPRVGFSYQPIDRLVIRGGYGITNYLEGTGANLRLTFNPPFQFSYEQQGTTPTSTSGGNSYMVENGFTSSATANYSSNTYRAWTKNLRPAFIQEFSLSAEYQIDNKTSIVMGYVGQTGQHLVDPRAGNQLSAPGATAPYASLVGQNGNVVITESEAMMNYNSGQFQVRHRQSEGLEYQVNYTYAKALTNNVGFYGVSGVNGASPYWQNAYDGHADYGPAGFDIRHNLTATAVYELPFGRGKKFGGNMNALLDEVVGGWKLTGTAVLYSGFPVNINGPNTANVNSKASRANHYRKLRIRNQSIDNWFGTDPSAVGCTQDNDNGVCAYGASGSNQFGDASVNSERAPGYRQIDLSAAKKFSITERQKFEFRAEFFNAFNFASYSNPDNGVNDSNFGQITDVRSPQRQIQFSAKYSF